MDLSKCVNDNLQLQQLFTIKVQFLANFPCHEHK